MEGEEKIKKFFFLFLGSGLLHAQSVWVIEKPAALRILNAFEQTVSSQDLEKWPVFSPVEMLEWSSLLGDGFTTAAKVRFDSRVFYIQRTTSGSLIGADRVGAMYPIPDGRRLQDTMIVDRPEGLHLHLWPSGLRTTIPQAEHLERFWQWENRQFVKRTSTGDMGWVIVDDHNSWSRYQPVRQTTPFNPVETVQSLLDSINKTARHVTEIVNAHENTAIASPQWTIRQKGTEAWIIEETTGSRRLRANKVVLERVQTALLGLGLSFREDVDQIEIRKP